MRYQLLRSVPLGSDRFFVLSWGWFDRFLDDPQNRAIVEADQVMDRHIDRRVFEGSEPSGFGLDPIAPVRPGSMPMWVMFMLRSAPILLSLPGWEYTQTRKSRPRPPTRRSGLGGWLRQSV